MKFHTIRNIIGLYLPEKFRHWFIYIPLYATSFFLVVTSVIYLKASQISGKSFFNQDVTSSDIDLQFSHLHTVLEDSKQSGRLDLLKGYSDFCGYSTEWPACFLMFYSMAAYERLQRQPLSSHYKNILESDLNLCSKLILRIPLNANRQTIDEYSIKRSYGSRHNGIYAGYIGVVLATRKLVLKDSLFDIALKKNSEGLAYSLKDNLNHATQFWSSDHATQIYALYLNDLATGESHTELFNQWEKIMKERFVEKKTGLLYSNIGTNPDHFYGSPRGSSVGWTALFLADVLPEFAKTQYSALCQYREIPCLNFRGTLEFPRKDCLSLGDTDSGPLILGLSPSATAITLNCHKIFNDQKRFTEALRPFEFFGKPHRDSNSLYYYRSNAMGDAILLLAKITSPRKLE